MVQSFLCVAMLTLLMYQKPYRSAYTYHLDVICYLSLIIQFGLQVLVRESDSLGIAPSPSSPFAKTLEIAAEASGAVRYIFPILFAARVAISIGA